MRVVRTTERQPGPFELRLEVAPLVDAEVAAWRVVVARVERPADALGTVENYRALLAATAGRRAC